MEGSETESERYDSDDGGDEHDSKGFSTLLDTAASEYGAPAASGVPTPWNNVLALARPRSDGDGSLAAQSLAPPVPLSGGTFVSPFEALHPSDSLQRGAACLRCSGTLDCAHIPGPLDDVELMFCVCCKRPMPLQQLTTITRNLKRCAACVTAGRSIHGLLDALKAELPCHLRRADYIAAVVKKQENVVLHYNAPREQALKFNAENDPRIIEVNTLAVAHYAAMADHIARRRALFRNPRATLDDTNRLFDEWVALERQRVSNDLQRLVVLDDLLASHFLPSTPKAIQLMKSLGLVPADAFPMAMQYDASEQCEECEILLTLPAPVVGDKLGTIGFCDCCKRMLPGDEMESSWSGARISFCKRCKRRRNFSLLMVSNLVGIPSLSWCRDLSKVVRAVSQRLQRANCLEGVAAARFVDAQQDVTRHEERVDGLKYYQEAVIREGNTPMAVSRHWYAEQAHALRGMEAALFKQLLLCTEAGADSGSKVWAPVVKFMHAPQLFSRRVLPEWLTTFVNDRWPQSAEQASTKALKLKAKTTPKPQATAAPPVAPPQSPTARPATAVTVAPSTGDPVDVKVDLKCERCAQVLSSLHGTGQPSFCDCCELMLPQSHTQTRLLHPRVSLCSVCFEALSKTKSIGEIASLVKRPNPDRIDGLQSHAGSLKHLIDVAAASETDESVDTRALSAVQEADHWKAARKQLRKRQAKDLLSKKSSFETRRKLYIEHIQTETALLEALVERVQVHLELMNVRNIGVSKKFYETITKSLKDDAPSMAEPVAVEDRSKTERRPTRVANDVVEPTAERKGHGAGREGKEPLGAQQLDHHARGREVGDERVVVLIKHDAKNLWGHERKASPPLRGMDELKHKLVNDAQTPTANKSLVDRSVRMIDRNADHTRRRSVSPEWTTSRFENYGAAPSRPRPRSQSRSPRYTRDRDRDRSRSRRRDHASTHGRSRSRPRSSPRYPRENERDRSRSLRRDHAGTHRRPRSRSRSPPRYRDNERGRSRSMRRDLNDPQRRSRSRSRSYVRDRSRSGPRNSASNMNRESRPIDESSRTAGREPMKDEKHPNRSRSRERPRDYAEAEKKPRHF